MNSHGFLPGDRVSFLRESGGGILKRVKPNGQAVVEIGDGFEVEFPLVDLVLAERSVGSVGVEKEGGTSPLSGRTVLKTGISDHGLNLFYMPGDAQHAADGMWRIFLINGGENEGFAILSETGGDKPRIFFSGEIKAFEVIPVADWNPGLPGVNREWVLQAIWKGAKEIIAPQNKKLGLKYAGKAPALTDRPEGFGSAGVLLTGSEPAPMREKDAPKSRGSEHVQEMKDHVVLEKRAGREMWKIDLHSSELPIDVTGLSNSQIFDLQTGFFERKLSEAQFHGVWKLVVVHGVGKGRLRDKVLEILNRQEGLKHYDGPMAEYGYGATVVEFFWA
jgi:hypothetical protein